MTHFQMIRFLFLYPDLLSKCLLRRMLSSGLLRRAARVRNDDSDATGGSDIRVTKIGELGTTQAATSVRFLRNVGSYKSHTA
jgi:hypothetical protein